MRKCLLVTLDYAPAYGGISAYWQRVTASMPQGKWRVLVPTLARWLWPRWAFGLIQVWQAYRRERCEMIIVGQVLPIGTIAYILRKLFGWPYVVQVYGMDLAMAKKSKRKAAMVGQILASADAVVANSRATAALTTDFGFAPKQCTVVYPVPGRIQARPDIIQALRLKHGLEGRKVLVTIGRLVARKGQDKVIEAMPQLQKRFPQAVYVVVGGGPDEHRLRTLARQKQANVLFTGPVSEDERNAWFALADVFVMASRPAADDVEGFGMVYLEAGSLGKPVIGGKGGGVAEAVQDGLTGLLVDPASVDDIAKVICRLLENPDKAAELGQAAKDAFDRKWNWDAELGKFKSLLA